MASLIRPPGIWLDRPAQGRRLRFRATARCFEMLQRGEGPIPSRGKEARLSRFPACRRLLVPARTARFCILSAQPARSRGPASRSQAPAPAFCVRDAGYMRYKARNGLGTQDGRAQLTQGGSRRRLTRTGGTWEACPPCLPNRKNALMRTIFRAKDPEQDKTASSWSKNRVSWRRLAGGEILSEASTFLSCGFAGPHLAGSQPDAENPPSGPKRRHETRFFDHRTAVFSCSEIGAPRPALPRLSRGPPDVPLYPGGRPSSPPAPRPGPSSPAARQQKRRARRRASPPAGAHRSYRKPGPTSRSPRSRSRRCPRRSRSRPPRPPSQTRSRRAS